MRSNGYTRTRHSNICGSDCRRCRLDRGILTNLSRTGTSSFEQKLLSSVCPASRPSTSSKQIPVVASSTFQVPHRKHSPGLRAAALALIAQAMRRTRNTHQPQSAYDAVRNAQAHPAKRTFLVSTNTTFHFAPMGHKSLFANSVSV